MRSGKILSLSTLLWDLTRRQSPSHLTSSRSKPMMLKRKKSVTFYKIFIHESFFKFMNSWWKTFFCDNVFVTCFFRQLLFNFVFFFLNVKTQNFLEGFNNNLKEKSFLFRIKRWETDTLKKNFPTQSSSNSLSKKKFYVKIKQHWTIWVIQQVKWNWGRCFFKV